MRLINLSDGEIIPHRLLRIDGIANVTSGKPTIVEISCSTSGTIMKTETTDSGRFRCIFRVLFGKTILVFRNMSITDDNLRVAIVCQLPDFQEHFRLIYIVSGKDESQFGTKWKEAIELRIGLAAEIIQTFIAEEIRRRYDFRRTFRLEYAKSLNGHVPYENASDVVCGQLKCEKWKEIQNGKPAVDLYWALVEEILNSTHFDPMAKYLVFLETTSNDTPNLGCGNVAVVSISNILYWPERWRDVQNALMATDCELLSDGNRTSGKCYGVEIGAALHELCHALDLVHTDSGVMGHHYPHLNEHFILNPTSTDPRCIFNDSQLSLLKDHWWLKGRDLGPLKEIEVRNGCVICEDGIAMVEIRKNGFTIGNWNFGVFPPRIWRPPEDALDALGENEENGSTHLTVMSYKGMLKKLNKLSFNENV